MSSFKERFKDKTSVVGKDGEHRQAPPPPANAAAHASAPAMMSSPPPPARVGAASSNHGSGVPPIASSIPRGAPPATTTTLLPSSGPPPAAVAPAVSGARVEKKGAGLIPVPSAAAPVAAVAPAAAAPRASFSLPTGFQPTGMFPNSPPPPLLVEEPSPTSPTPAAAPGKKSKATERDVAAAKKRKPDAPPPPQGSSASATAGANANASTGSSLPPPLESTAKPSLVAARGSETHVVADTAKSFATASAAVAAASSSPTKGGGQAANARKAVKSDATGATLPPAAALTPPPPATLSNNGAPQSVLAALRERSLQSHPAAAASPSSSSQPPHPVHPKPTGGRRAVADSRASPQRDACAAVRPRSDPSPSREEDHPRREITYKPYGVEDYRRLKDELAKKVSGGLGPSDTDEQRAAAARLQRQREYAENIKRINHVILLHHSASDESGVGEDGDGETPTTSPRPARRTSQVHVPQETLEKQQRRERAIAYAKNVPRPKLRISKEDDPILQPQPGHEVPLVLDKEGQTKMERERALADLEAKHEQDQRMVDNIKKQLRL